MSEGTSPTKAGSTKVTAVSRSRRLAASNTAVRTSRVSTAGVWRPQLHSSSQGRVAQWESARFTRERSQVRTPPRPFGQSRCGSRVATDEQWNHVNKKEVTRRGLVVSLSRLARAPSNAGARRAEPGRPLEEPWE